MLLTTSVAFLGDSEICLGSYSNAYIAVVPKGSRGSFHAMLACGQEQLVGGAPLWIAVVQCSYFQWLFIIFFPICPCVNRCKSFHLGLTGQELKTYCSQVMGLEV